MQNWLKAVILNTFFFCYFSAINEDKIKVRISLQKYDRAKTFIYLHNFVVTTRFSVYSVP